MKTIYRSFLSGVMSVAVLAGCASGGYTGEQIQALVSKGRCVDAKRLIETDGDAGNRAYGLGWLATTCDRDFALTERYFTLGARYGNQNSIDYLVRNGKPVPTADLRQQQQQQSNQMSNAEALALILGGVAQGKRDSQTAQSYRPSQPDSPNVTCKTQQDGLLGKSATNPTYTTTCK